MVKMQIFSIDYDIV